MRSTLCVLDGFAALAVDLLADFGCLAQLVSELRDGGARRERVAVAVEVYLQVAILRAAEKLLL